MSKKYHHIVHDKLASILLVMTLVFSFYIFMNIVKLQNEEIIKNTAGQDYRYKRVYCHEMLTESLEEKEKTEIDTDSKKPSSIFRKPNRISEGNIIIPDLVIQCGSANYYADACVVIEYNEPCVEEVKDGEFISQSQVAHKEKGIVIGRRLLRFCTQKGEVYFLKIGSKEYKVSGILKNQNDDRIFLFYDSLYQDTKELIDRLLMSQNVGYHIIYASNQKALEQSDEVEKWLHSFVDPSLITTEEEYELENSDYEDMITFAQNLSKYMMVGIFAFCLCVCFVVSSVWIKRKQKELVIRKAFGGSLLYLIWLLFKDLLVLILIALVMDGVLFMTQIIVTNDYWVLENYVVHNFKTIMLGMAAIIVVTMARPIYMVAKLSPAQGIRLL